MNNFSLDIELKISRNPLWLFNQKNFFDADISQNYSSVFSSQKIFKCMDTATMSDDLVEAIEDTRARKNLHGPFKTAEEAVAAMLGD